MWLKVVILILFIAVIASLGTGFYFLLTGDSRSPNLLRSLKVRISLTVLIMLVIVIAWLHGDVQSQAPWIYR